MHWVQWKWLQASEPVRNPARSKCLLGSTSRCPWGSPVWAALSTGCWDHGLFWVGDGLCSVPSQSWKNFTAEGRPPGLRCNLFLNTFCIHYLMALDYCHYFRSSARLRIMFQCQAQATGSWNFHFPLFFFGVAGMYFDFWRQTFCILLHLNDLLGLKRILPLPIVGTEYLWEVPKQHSSAFPRFSIWF